MPGGPKHEPAGVIPTAIPAARQAFSVTHWLESDESLHRRGLKRILAELSAVNWGLGLLSGSAPEKEEESKWP